MNYKLNIKPSKEQLFYIKAWLSQELEETGEGFGHNFNIIKDYFDRNQLILLLYESQSIGFTTWEIIDEIVLKIDIACIQSKFRFKGAGKFMIQETFEYFKSKGVVVTELFCQPRSSENFWKSIGFIDMPKIRFNQHELFLYYPLITPYSKSDSSENDMIELWNCEPHIASTKDAKWI